MIDAKDWLLKYLADGEPHYVKEIRKDARSVGLLKSDLRMARKEIGRIVTESNFNPLTEETDWFWRLK